MQMGSPIRLYISPQKLLQAMFPLGVFVLIGISIIERAPTSPIYLIVGIAVLLPTGLFAVLVITDLAYGVVLHRPLLEVDERGWHKGLLSLGGVHVLEWAQLDRIECSVRQLRNDRISCYVLVWVRDSDKLPHKTRRKLSARLLPSLQGAAMGTPLNLVVQQCTPDKAFQLFDRITTTFSREIEMYGIKVQHSVKDLTPKARKDRT